MKAGSPAMELIDSFANGVDVPRPNLKLVSSQKKLAIAVDCDRRPAPVDEAKITPPL